MRVKRRKDRRNEYYGLTDDCKMRCPLCGKIVNISHQNVYETGGMAYHTKCLFDNYQKIIKSGGGKKNGRMERDY